MEDKNNNMIPDHLDKIIGMFLAVVVGILLVAIEGKWGGGYWVAMDIRVLAVISIMSSVFKWGIVGIGTAKKEQVEEVEVKKKEKENE